MSFILDALKKSESDRQRQNGPALFEVRVAPPRTRLPLWAIAIALLLVVNLGIVMWMLLRHPGHAAAARTAGEPAALAPATTTPAPPAPATIAASQGLGGGSASVPVVATSAPAAGGAAPAPGLAAAPTVAAQPTAAAGAAVAAPTPGTASGANSANAAQDSSRPEDYAPAEETPSGGGSHVQRGTSSGVPLYQDLSATPGTQLPQLRLDLHVYAARPQDRFVMINMHKLREGDTLPEGVHVDSITPEGAVLTYNGSRFLLPRD
jgi:general secretion pathway protein B